MRGKVEEGRSGKRNRRKRREMGRRGWGRKG